jgi:uncharacterized membrane protein
MDKKEINQAEWENPAYWTAGPKWLCVYFSHKDSRTWVPKRIPWMGVTINMAKPGGVAWLIGFILGIPLFIVLLSFFAMKCIK